MFSAKCGQVAILNIAVKSNFITRECFTSLDELKLEKKKKPTDFNIL